MREGLRPKTVSNQIVLLQLMLKRAIRWRLMHSNPVEGCERPRDEQFEMNVLTEAEIAHLWNAYERLEREAPVEERVWWRTARTLTFVALGTAMRRGELLALRWRDVQLLEGLLHVREALVEGLRPRRRPPRLLQRAQLSGQMVRVRRTPRRSRASSRNPMARPTTHSRHR
jgi:integrase